MSELDNQLSELANEIRKIVAPEGTDAMSLDDMATLLGAAEWRNDFLKSLIERTATSITIPGTVYIEKYAFAGCDNLTSITIPSSFIGIHPAAFQSCINLTDIYCGFAEGEVSGAPWGAPDTATIHYGAA